MSLESRVHLHPEVLKLSTALNNPRCTVTTASQVRVCRLGAQLRGCHVASNAQDPGLIPSTEKKKSVFPTIIFLLPKLVLVGKVTIFKIIPLIDGLADDRVSECVM